MIWFPTPNMCLLLILPSKLLHVQPTCKCNTSGSTFRARCYSTYCKQMRRLWENIKGYQACLHGGKRCKVYVEAGKFWARQIWNKYQILTHCSMYLQWWAVGHMTSTDHDMRTFKLVLNISNLVTVYEINKKSRICLSKTWQMLGILGGIWSWIAW